MARRSSGLRTVVKVVKAIDRASKRAERDRQRRNRETERETQRRIREVEQESKARQRLAEQALRAKVREEALAIKDELQIAKECFEDRAEERRLVKEEIISKYMR